MAQHSMTSSGPNEPFSTPKSAVGPKPAKALCTPCFSHFLLADELTKPRVQPSVEREVSVEREAMPAPTTSTPFQRSCFGDACSSPAWPKSTHSRAGTRSGTGVVS